MTTKLDAPLRRELAVDGRPYVLTITPDGFSLVPKGRRKGRELAWRDLVSGEAALAVALNASLGDASVRPRAPIATAAPGRSPGPPSTTKRRRPRSRSPEAS
jgi:hypothetical protein